MIPKQLDCEPIPGDMPRTIFRDDDVWAIDKPRGWLTHTDGNDARPNVVSWCSERVGVHHRLDIDTTGVLVFSRSREGADRVQRAFASRTVEKSYLAVVETAPSPASGRLTRSMPGPNGKDALTKYKLLHSGTRGHVLECTPITGRTHQIRVHLSQINRPIIGDARYGDPLDRRAPRTLLHCKKIHVPGWPEWVSSVPDDIQAYLSDEPHISRRALTADESTTCYREIHGSADQVPDCYVDRYDEWLWVQRDAGSNLIELPKSKGVYLVDGVRDRSHGEQSPVRLLSGTPAPEHLEVREHGIRYLVELGSQLSTGLFLDQRPQRAWLSQNAGGLRVLNTFAHAGGFSVAAATAGAETVSLDLSRDWLARIPKQLEANGVDPRRHDQIYGDVFNWMPRLARRGERFDLVILDPPSTSVGKKKKRWSAAKDYPELVRIASQLVAPGGALWTCTNHRGLEPRRFAKLVDRGLPDGVILERCAPLEVDFPCSGPPHLKTLVWRWPK